MKQNKVKLYAKALAEVLAKNGVDEKKVTNNFVKLLISAGLEKKSKEILDLAEDFLLAKQGKNKITYETPNDFQQEKMGKFILNLVKGQQNNRDREELIRIIDDFDGKNIDCVILACTDLQLLIPRHQKLKIFDTMKILAGATVDEILK